jgi:hypothetical protein
MDFVTMQVNSDSARSHGWWRNLVVHGPWNGESRVGPPGPEALPGIARLFGTTPEQVAVMIAADWYGVRLDTAVSPRVLRIAPILDHLNDGDAGFVEMLAHRLATGGYGAVGRETGTKLWNAYTAAEPIAQPHAV